MQSVNASNGGEYTCIVFNDAGIGFSYSYLYIQPYFTKEPQDIELDFVESFTLECEAESFPYSTIQWQKQSNNGDFYDIRNEESITLVFEKALLSDSGVYRCVATNIINGTEYMSNSANAIVQGKYMAEVFSKEVVYDKKILTERIKLKIYNIKSV